jgi:hypothetical protein
MNSTDYIYCVFGNMIYNDFVKVFLIKNILKIFNLILISIYQKTKNNFKKHSSFIFNQFSFELDFHLISITK